MLRRAFWSFFNTWGKRQSSTAANDPKITTGPVLIYCIKKKRKTNTDKIKSSSVVSGAYKGQWLCLNMKIWSSSNSSAPREDPGPFQKYSRVKNAHSMEVKGLPLVRSCALWVEPTTFKQLPWELFQVSVTASLLPLRFMKQPNTNCSKLLAGDGSSLSGKLIRDDTGTNQKSVMFLLRETLQMG